MQPSELKQLVVDALEALKGEDIVILDVAEITHVTDYMIIVSGSSSRHVKSLAESVIQACKQKNIYPLGVEGADKGEWVLVDFCSTVVHVMLPSTRQFYDLQRLWETTPLALKSKA